MLCLLPWLWRLHRERRSFSERICHEESFIFGAIRQCYIGNLHEKQNKKKQHCAEITGTRNKLYK